MNGDGKEISPHGGYSRAPARASRWTLRRPGAAPEISEISSTPPPTGSVTVRDVWVRLARDAARWLAPWVAVGLAWWLVSPYLGAALGVVLLGYRVVTSGRPRRSSSTAVARVERSPRRWSR